MSSQADLERNSEGVAEILKRVHPIAILFPGVLLLIAAVKYIVMPFNHDNAVHLKAARTILDHGSLYSHLYEVNPPFFPYLTVIPVSLARATGGSEVFFYNTLVFLLATLVVFLITTDLKKERMLANSSSLLFVPGALIFILLGIQQIDLGQRDHLCGILMLPYVVQLGLRVGGTGSGTLKPVHAVLLALAIAIKPQFLPVWIIGEIFVWVGRRSFASIWGLGNGLVASAGMLYLALVLILEPLFYSEILPMVRQSYGAYGRSLGMQDLLTWVRMSGLQAIFSIVLISMGDPASRRLRVSLAAAFFLAAQGAFAGFVLQAHFRYQMWPYLMITFASLPVLLDWGDQGVFAKHKRLPSFIGQKVAPVLLVLLMALSTPLWVWPVALSRLSGDTGDDTYAWSSRYPDLEAQVALIEHYAAHKSYYVISSNIFTSFPAEYYSSASWPMRYPVLWPLPGLAGREGDEYVRLRGVLRSQVAQDLARHRPALLLVDVSEEKHYFPIDKEGRRTFDYLKFFDQSEVFRSILSTYVPCGTFIYNQEFTFQIFVSGAIEPSKRTSCGDK